MAERVNINVITNTLRNNAQTLAAANRLAQLDKERRKRLEAESKRLRKAQEQANPWPGAVPEVSVDPELAAIREGDKVAVGFSQGSSTSLTVWSADQQASATTTLPTPPSTTGSTSTVVFPFVDFYNNTFPLVSGPVFVDVDRIISINGAPTGNGPVWEALRAPDNIRTQSYSIQTSVTVHLHSPSLTLVLPINGTSFILATWARAQARPVTTVYTTGYSRYKYDFFYYTYENPVVVDGFATGEYDTIEAVQWLPGGIGGGLDVWRVLLDYTPPSTTYTDGTASTVEYLRCFVVGRSSCREISAPPGLTDVFNGLSPPATWVSSTSLSSGYWDIPDSTSLGDAINTRLPGGSSDAGIYKAISDPAGAEAASTPSELATFFAGTPRPRYALSPCQLSGTCTVDVVGFDKTTNPDDETPLYRRYRYADVRTGPRSRTQHTAWDWGKSTYCKQRLLALGFTPADFVP